ncbi:MAG: hypothetical protein QXQ94_10230 [Candidatus Bathyarchaeia archaeon]|nr:hypothetical protein [Candidatus Brockarchaeota archaeon]
MSTLIVDGVKYKLWTPKDEEKEFHPLVRKCYKEIFDVRFVVIGIE